MADGRICIGVVRGAHGLKGAVKVRPFTDDPLAVGDYGPVESEDGGETFEVEVLHAVKGGVLVRLSGVRDRTAAEGLKGLKLFVDRDRLPPPEEDEFYYSDLIGLAVKNMAGETVGRVKAVQDFGAGDLLEITFRDRKATVLVPLTKEAVPEISLGDGFVVIDPPPGLLDKPVPPEGTQEPVE